MSATGPRRDQRRERAQANGKVFVVNDDRDVLLSLKFVLRTAGFEIRAFSSGRSLLASRSKRDADCFILDYRMRGMDGVDLARRLRASGLTAPIVLIAGFPSVGLEAKAEGAGVGRLIFAPHVDEDLIRRLTLAIGERRSRSDLRESP